MSKERVMGRPIIGFLVLSNLIFWMFLGVIGICMKTGMLGIVIETLIVIAAWSSTFSFLLLFKRNCPGFKLKDFVKRQFEPKVKLLDLVWILTIQIGIFAAAMFFVDGSEKIQMVPISGAGYFVLLFFSHLIRGPLGEELGWRGYMLNELQRKHSPFFSSIIVGVFWGFWHMPLWLLTSGYSGVGLVKYSILFLVAIISLSIIMTFFYNRSKNLIIPILIHQLFNFLLSLINAEIVDGLFYMASFYLVAAAVIIAFNASDLFCKKYSRLELSK